MLDQNAQKTLDRSKNGSVNHNRTVLFVIFIDVVEIESFGLGHVQLNGAALPGPV
jgi:hypothetical protein